MSIIVLDTNSPDFVVLASMSHRAKLNTSSTILLISLLSRNQSETLTQNYRRLGLTSRLNSATGGVEKLKPGLLSSSSTTSKLAISNAIPKQLAPTEAVVERDADGKIIRVIHANSRPNPLNDPLNSDSEDEVMDDSFEGFDGEEGNEGQEGKEIVRQLEDMASREKAKTPRKQSEREKEWCERLVGRWGSDYKKMERDRRLNPMQQTEADIRRRVEKWKASNASKEGAVVGV
jgi:nucleolar protein 16